MKCKIISLIFILCFVSKINSIDIPLEGSGGTNVGFVDMEKIFEEHPEYSKIQQEYKELSDIKNKEIEKIRKDTETLTVEITTITINLDELKKELNELIDLQKKTEIKISSQIPEISTWSVPMGSEISKSTDITINISTTNINISTNVITETSPKYEFHQDTGPTILDLIQQQQAKIIEEKTILNQKQQLLSQKEKEIEEKEIEKQKELDEFKKNKMLYIMKDFYNIIEQLAKEENISIIVEKSSILYGLPQIDLTQKVRERLRGR